MARRLTFWGPLFALVLVLGVLVAPAGAHHKGGHDRGGNGNAKAASPARGGSGGSGFTEDNDTNDGGTPNGVVDDGDNRHPSGKDKSVEHGNSGNQGNSSSDPDDDGRGPDRSNGGADKPNGPGGEDLADQDGNNGCGNDDDFEDDNEGWCGKPKETTPEVDDDGRPPEIDDDVLDDAEKLIDVFVDAYVPKDKVLGTRLVRSDVDASADRVAADVLERSASEDEGGAALPFTGADLTLFVMTGIGLAGAGSLLLRARRR